MMMQAEGADVATASCQSTSSSGQSVRVESSTWSRDSHELFDFEAAGLKKRVFQVDKSARCFRRGTDVEMTEDMLAPLRSDSDPLLRLVQKDGTFYVERSSPTQHSKKLWLVVRDLAEQGHRLSEGDVIKLGRFRFFVRQLVGAPPPGRRVKIRVGEESNEFNTVHVDPAVSGLTSQVCRICLTEGSEDGDPLIAPCQCRGTIESVHLGCLRQWINGRLGYSDKSGSFLYKPLACELCKYIYPTYVDFGHEKASLVEVPQTQPPFIVLENQIRDNHNHTSRANASVHVVSLAEKPLKLGRGHESDVRIADVSISRCHATISYEDGSFFLRDNNSKFGTLVALKKPRPLENGQPISVQMGRTVLNLSLQQGSMTRLPELVTSSREEKEERASLRLPVLPCKEGAGSGSGSSGEEQSVPGLSHLPREPPPVYRYVGPGVPMEEVRTAL
eukprot:TRINITY_DN22286_c0_g1_i1.p1 TRINITY_DN22286_c0_g1~~TRINITY_DN22286_c0_g1_i1.p1  ORF type:complete len:446 (+),score=79.90 TRINITY_DN22286_c0_g1_i1:101-1438(+)